MADKMADSAKPGAFDYKRIGKKTPFAGCDIKMQAEKMALKRASGSVVERRMAPTKELSQLTKRASEPVPQARVTRDSTNSSKETTKFRGNSVTAADENTPKIETSGTTESVDLPETNGKHAFSNELYGCASEQPSLTTTQTTTTPPANEPSSTTTSTSQGSQPITYVQQISTNSELTDPNDQSDVSDQETEHDHHDGPIGDDIEPSPQEHYQIVAAIDFGTTFSGYAFSLSSDPANVYANKNWGQHQGFLLYKTPTCLLLDGDGHFVAFGFEAVSKYNDLSDEEVAEYYYFDRFKMKLFNNKDLNTELTIEAANGKLLYAVDVFSLSLSAMRTYLTKAVEDHTGYPPDPTVIRWVVTVPAIWDENAKQFMREAALRVQMIDSKTSNQLLIALEPEAASLHCRTLPASTFVGLGKDGVAFEPGTKYLVVDAGGGTIDIVAHKVRSDGRIRELLRASGGAWGGTMVDQQFVDLLTNIFGQEFLNEFRTNYQKDYLELLQDFEVKKRADSDVMRVSLPYNFCNFKHDDVTVPALIKKYAEAGNGDSVKFSSGKLVLKADVINLLFDDVIKQIIDHVTELLNKQKLSDCSYIFLVGGFAECARLQRAFKDNFSDRATVLIPEEASLAVVRGAVTFGHNPASIGQRVCRYTYGVSSHLPYQEGIHREDLKIESNGQNLCKNIFQIWASAGEMIGYNDVWSETYTPIIHNQQGIVFEFYKSHRKKVTYVDEKGVRKCGELVINMPDGTGDMERTVDLEVRFGGTELEIVAFDHTSQTQVVTNIDLLAS